METSKCINCSMKIQKSTSQPLIKEKYLIQQGALASLLLGMQWQEPSQSQSERRIR